MPWIVYIVCRNVEKPRRGFISIAPRPRSARGVVNGFPFINVGDVA
jgi:hypothetical protein